MENIHEEIIRLKSNGEYMEYLTPENIEMALTIIGWLGALTGFGAAAKGAILGKQLIKIITIRNSNFLMSSSLSH